MTNVCKINVVAQEGMSAPEYATNGSAGFDLASSETIVLQPGEKRIVSTGLSFDIPEGLEMQIRPRSGLSLKQTLRICNSPGTIDSDYTGVVGIIMENYGDEAIVISKGDRVAQGVIAPYFRAVFKKTDKIEKDTERGSGGYGSTGK